MRFGLFIILFIGAYTGSLSAQELTPTAGREQKVCQDVFLQSAEEITFTPAEKKLICGNSKLNAWRSIPPNEASYFIRSFLQTRGYHDVDSRIEKDHLLIVVHRETIVKNIVFVDPTPPVDIKRYWPIFGRPLTPQALDDLEKWLRQELGRKGFACPQIKITADPSTGVVSIAVTHMEADTFPPVISDGIAGLVGGVERRYDAFATGEPYDSLLLDLTSRRMIADGIVINSYFLTKCKNSATSPDIVQKINSGEPRLISLGFGLDTEEFLIGRAQWKNSRFGTMGSNLEALATASYRVQEARFTFNWYYAPIITSHFLRTRYNFRRENERRHDTRTHSLSVGPVWNIDMGNVNTSISPDVSYDHVETVRGLGDPTTDFLWTSISFTGQSHEFEYYLDDPRSGYDFDLNAGVTRRDIGSNINANRYAFSFTRLWNLFDYSPPIWVMGIRSRITTIVADNQDSLIMPPNYRYNLGGSQNLRGFARNALPPRDLGAMTSAYVGVETRIGNVFPYGLQPIAFVDIGGLGDRPLALDPTRYYSPGAGLHWKSPIGTFRLTAAHGLIAGEKQEELRHLSRWLVHLSYGEQF